MKRKVPPVEAIDGNWQDNSGSLPKGFHDLNPYAPYFSYASVPNVPYLDLGIYRESRVKSLIKTRVRICTSCLRRLILMENTTG